MAQQRTFYAPGRVNLIGEYTDFNGGLVFPCAINRGTRVTVTEHTSAGIELSSADFDFTTTVDMAGDINPIDKEWVNYPLGILREFANIGFDINGLKLHYTGDLPHSAGLSSSASISVLTAVAMDALLDAGLTSQELAILAQRAENEFINVQCGIMDQFIIAKAKAGCAIALDCASLDHQQVPLNLGDYRLVIGNTNQPRELKSSAYNDRVEECHAALKVLGPIVGVEQLAHVTPLQLREHKHLLTDDVVRNRATHVIEESDRVQRATIALKNGNLEEFGQMMVQSHESLRKLFEVSSDTLDCMVDLALNVDGVIGSRMTGAGFGGCTVSLVHADSVDNFIKSVGDSYSSAMNLKADFYVTTAMGGASEVSS